MFKPILLAALGVLLATGARADADCKTAEDVIAKVEANAPGAAHVIYDNRERDGILNGMSRVSAAPPSEGLTFLVFRHSDMGTVLIVGMRNGCAEGALQVPRSVLDNWLAGQGAAQ